MNTRIICAIAILTLAGTLGCVPLNKRPGHNLAPNGMPIRDTNPYATSAYRPQQQNRAKPPIDRGADALAESNNLINRPTGYQPPVVRGQTDEPNYPQDEGVRQAQFIDESNNLPGARPGVVPNPNGPNLQGVEIIPPGQGGFPPPPGGVQPIDPLQMPDNFADINAFVQEARTGRFMFGVGFNSEAGVTGQIVIDERNFDIRKPPLSYNDFIYGNPFRGGGQGFRLEAVPGTQVQRYMLSFSEPHLRGTQISLNTSAFFFDRNYFDWDEQRYGGRIATGYRLNHDLSLSLATRLENINIHNPRVNNNPEVNGVLGNNQLYSGQVSLTHDTRDLAFAATEGHLLEVNFEQVFGTFVYPRGEIDWRQYFLLSERADGSGRHTLSYSTKASFTGGNTPVYDNYFAGGFSTMRGFDFRGASPLGTGGVIVGGEFRLLTTVEYMFPLTADDMLKGVVFVDAGTVEEKIAINADDFRVAPGFGLRLFIPAMGPAPLAFDFAFPVAMEDTDSQQIFSFFLGFGR